MLGTLLSSIKKRYTARGVALMYHRIGTSIADPWELAVSPENFEAHLKVLKSYNLISVMDLSDILSKKSKMPSRAVTVTFDDGYRDNYLIAKPLLEKYNVPASFFIPTAAIGGNREFWWDALARICLQSPDLPDQLSIEQPDNSSWNISSSGECGTSSPMELYLELCVLIRKMPEIQKHKIIEQLKSWSRNVKDRPEYFTMNKEELLDMQSNKLFTIGAHTATHPFLPDLTFEEQKQEIGDSIDSLEGLTGKQINSLAYPHGGRDQNTIAILSDSAISVAFTTDPQCFTADTYRHTIPRFQVRDWDGETFALHLKQWLKN